MCAYWECDVNIFLKKKKKEKTVKMLFQVEHLYKTLTRTNIWKQLMDE